MARRSFAQDWYDTDRPARSTPEGVAGGVGIGGLLLVPLIGLDRLVMALFRGRRRRSGSQPDSPPQ